MTISHEFVVLDPLSDPKPGKCLQIRSRCMQGKNKREGSRRSQREKRRRAKEEDVAAQRPQEIIAPGVPPPVSIISDLALVRFAGSDIDSEAKGLLFKAFAYNVANHTLSPLDRCVNFGLVDSASFEWLFSDATFLHSTLCASYAVNDFTNPHWDGKPGRRTVIHLRETLSLLRAKISNECAAYQDESVLYVIINLVLLAAVLGDREAAVTHLKGLQKIVQLRGNLEILRTRPRLHFKLDRLDLALSLSSGAPPFFLNSTASWDPIILPPYSFLSQGRFQPPPEWDFRLVNVFLDLQYLSVGINYNVSIHARYDAAYFQGVLTSLQSRLVRLNALLKSPVEQLVCLALLAFLATTVKIPKRQISYDWVIRQLRYTYAKAAREPVDMPKSLALWVLMAAAFSVTGAPEEWIRHAWSKTAMGHGWEVVKNHLMQVMWLESIHDGPGELLFRHLGRWKAQ